MTAEGLRKKCFLLAFNKQLFLRYLMHQQNRCFYEFSFYSGYFPVVNALHIRNFQLVVPFMTNSNAIGDSYCIYWRKLRMFAASLHSNRNVLYHWIASFRRQFHNEFLPVPVRVYLLVIWCRMVMIVTCEGA